jgi:hypothetical protein
MCDLGPLRLRLARTSLTSNIHEFPTEKGGTLTPRTSRPRILLAWHFVRSFRRECVVGLPGIVLGAISVSLSAMMYWAFTFQGNGSNLSPEGLDLILVGAAGFVMSAFVFSMSRSSENTHHTFDRQVSDLNGGVRSNHRSKKKLTLRVLSSATTRPPCQILPARGTSDRLNVSATSRRC